MFGASALTHDEGTEVFVDEQAQVAGHDLVAVAVADGDAVHILQSHLRPREREAAGYGEAVFRWDSGAGERADVEEDDDGGGGFEFLEEVDEDCGGAVGGASLVEEDADAAETGDGRTA